MTRMTKEGYKEYLKSKPKKKYNNTKIYMNKYTFHVVIKEIFEEHKNKYQIQKIMFYSIQF